MPDQARRRGKCERVEQKSCMEREDTLACEGSEDSVRWKLKMSKLYNQVGSLRGESKSKRLHHFILSHLCGSQSELVDYSTQATQKNGYSYLKLEF